MTKPIAKSHKPTPGSQQLSSDSVSGLKAVDPTVKLTDFLDVATLQDIQDSLAMVAQVKATILDTTGQPLTQTTVSERFSTRSAAIAAARKQKGDSELDQPFFAKGNIATAGGCLASQYLACWVIARLEGIEAASGAMHYVAPVGEKEEYVERMLRNVTPFLGVD